MAVITARGCPHCGAAEEIEFSEVYPELREFDLTFCCEEAEAEWRESFDQVGRKEWVAFFRSGAGMDVRQITPGLDAALRIDWGLEVGRVKRREANEYIARHHRHNSEIQGDIFRLAAHNGPDLIAVATVGKPVARENERRSADGTRLVLEVTRLCVRDDLLVPGLKWNACSQLYSAAARQARELGAHRLITYTLVSEPGTSLLACGWKPLYNTDARRQGWDTPSRPRDSKLTPNGAKVCWEKRLVEGLDDLNQRAALWRLRGWRPVFGASAVSRQLNLFAVRHSEFHIESSCAHCIAYATGSDLCRECARPMCPACDEAARGGLFACHVAGADDETVEAVAEEVIGLRRSLGPARASVDREAVGRRYRAAGVRQHPPPGLFPPPQITGGARQAAA